MAYDSKKAKGRDANPADVTDGPRNLKGSASNQERATGDGVKRVAVPVNNVEGNGYMSKQRTVGNQVKLSPNTKGSDTLKDPLNTYQRKVMPAVADPDPIANRDSAPYARRAAKKENNAAKTRL